MIRKFFAFFLIIGLFLTLSACSEPVKKKSGGKVGVVVTFNALAEFARAVGGNRISLTTIIPDGVEPHDFEPKVKDMKLISDADV
ncbi:MAG TPA: zinc ABC transporter substrate-binding protein, partial [Clostridia bacterium]|nr:zinc ABC transporter substrate-binding protein [Clostridia bacterium]